MNKKCYKRIIVIFIAFLLGVFIGYLIGTFVTIKAVAEITKGFLNQELIEKAIFQYKNNIRNCFPAINITT